MVVVVIFSMAVLHPDDMRQILVLRKDLAGWRAVARKTQMQTGRDGGLGSDHVISDMEGGNYGSFRMSNTQGFAAGVGQVFRWYVHGLPAPAYTAELTMMDTMASAGTDPMWDRMLVVSTLRHIRMEQGVQASALAAPLQVHKDTVAMWERSSTDPHLYRLLSYTRALGGHMTFGLQDA